jgi:hypothetical protein
MQSGISQAELQRFGIRSSSIYRIVGQKFLDTVSRCRAAKEPGTATPIWKSSAQQRITFGSKPRRPRSSAETLHPVSGEDRWESGRSEVIAFRASIARLTTQVLGSNFTHAAQCVAGKFV